MTNGNNRPRSRAVLRIVSQNMSLDEISNFLNARPTSLCYKGEPYSKRNPNSKTREENIWLLESEHELSEYEPLELHINHIISFVRTKLLSIRALQQQCEIDVFCSFSFEFGQSSFTLDHGLLKKLNEIPLELIVDLYVAEKEHDDEDTPVVGMSGEIRFPNRVKVSTAGLRITSQYMRIDEISNVLNVRATISKENTWFAKSELKRTEPLESHIEHILIFVRANKVAFIKYLQSKCKIDIVCSFSSENGQGSLVLDYELLRKLTEIPLDLVVNVYPPD